jgi:hypothetical protein
LKISYINWFTLYSHLSIKIDGHSNCIKGFQNFSSDNKTETNSTEKVFNFEELQNGKYETKFAEIELIRKGSYGQVFKAESKFDKWCKFKKAFMKNEIISSEENKIYRKLRNFLKFQHSIDDTLVLKCQNAWFELNSDSNKLILFLQMELCDENLRKFIEDLNKSSILKNSH